MSFKNTADELIKKNGFLFIAEISNNHLGNLNRYKQLIEAASKAGAHAVKIQTYIADSLCLRNEE